MNYTYHICRLHVEQIENKEQHITLCSNESMVRAKQGYERLQESFQDQCVALFFFFVF